MRRILWATLSAFALLLISFLLTTNASAQCPGVFGLGGISSAQSGTPFQAEVTQTFISHIDASSPTARPFVQQVARDSQGRVRVDTTGGKFKVEAGVDQGTEQEEHHITICDPIKQERIVLDTLNKTATVWRTGLSSTAISAVRSLSATPGDTTFCSRQLQLGAHAPGAEITDLGHRNIEGLDAHGVQRKHNFPVIAGSSETTQVSVSESWCSDELGAIVLRNNGTEAKGTTMSSAMTNIQRGEPDPVLFQIPPDYRVVERVNEPGAHQGAVFSQGFGSSGTAVEAPAPAKP